MMRAVPYQDKSPLLSTLKEVAFFVAIYLYFAGYVYFYYYYENFGISLNAIDIPVYYFFVYAFNVLLALQRGEVWVYALRSQWVVILVIAILTAIGMLAFRKWKLKVLIIALLVLLFPMTFSFALKAAELNANDVRRGKYIKPITLAFKDEAMKIFAQKIPNNGAGAQETTKKPTASNDKKQTDSGAQLLDTQPTPENLSLLRLLDANSQKFLKPSDEKCMNDEGKEIVKGDPVLWLLAETKDRLYVLYQPWNCLGQALPSGYVYEVSKSDITFAEVTVR
jgi:Tfp pilus assembly major pilin PilA